MNTTQLQPPPSTEVQRIVQQGDEKEVEFLALRLLNKQARVRLSDVPLQLGSLPGRAVLFTTANHTGYFAAVSQSSTGTYGIKLGTLAALRNAFATSEGDEDIPFVPECLVPVDGTPTAITFASNDSKLVVGLISGSILAYDMQTLASRSSGAISPSHIFPPSSGTAPRDIVANPGDLPNICAVLYEPTATGQRIDLLDTQKSQVVGTWISAGTPETTPSALSWSTKGKQLAIGLQSGDIVTYSPTDTSQPKMVVPGPSFLTGQSVIGLSWLSNSEFHCIFAPAGALSAESEQTHALLSLDSKTNSLTEVKLSTPYLPYPGLRPPGSFSVVLRHWDPARFLLFIGDGTSSDIGLLGCIGESTGLGSWTNLTLEETSTPSVPLDKDSNDTVPVGLALDLTGIDEFKYKTASGEDSNLPAPPVMYLYASDGTLVAWSVLNTRANPYPGMIKPSSLGDSMKTSAPTSQPVIPTIQVNEPTVPSPSPNQDMQPASAFSQTSGSGFGQNTFGKPTSLQTSGFGQSPSFGSSPSIAPVPSSSGFGAFASAGPAKFGFGSTSLAPPATMQSPSSPAPPSPIAMSISNSEEPMSADVDTAGSGFGGLSLGGSNNVANSDAPKSSMFGTFGAPAQTPGFGNTSSLGGSSNILKPATGAFGAFSGQAPSAFGTSAFGPGTSSASESIKPASSFGATELTTPKPTTASAFGKPSFGTQPAFGASAFGQSAFGTSTFGSTAKPTSSFGSSSTPSSSTSTGGFAAFAQAGTTPFGNSASKTGGDIKAAENMPPRTSDSTSALAEVPKTPPRASSVFSGGEPTTPRPIPAFGAPSTPEKPNSNATTPSSSPFKSTSPGPTTGAFASLATHPTGFGPLQPGSGAFGAFGNVSASSSPFFNPPKTPTASAFGSPVSAFASTPSTPKASGDGSTKPAFGATSALGMASTTPEKRSAFGSPSQLGSQSVFGTSSFGASTTPSVSSPAATSTAFSAFAGSAGFKSFASSGTKSFSDLLQEKNEESKLKEPTSPSPDKSQPKRTSVTGTALNRIKSAEEASGIQNDETSDEESDGGDEAAEDQDDVISFLSQSFSEEEEGADEDLEEVTPVEANDEKVEKESGESAVGKKETTPASNASLTLSSPENSTAVSPAVAAKTNPPESKDTTSTTPPGTPEKSTSAVVASPVPTTSPFSLGIGRPSTRPTRSSPLANVPISGNDNNDTSDQSRKGLDVLKKPASPDNGKAAAPSPTAKTELPAFTTPSRAKTPPLLPTFAPPMPNPKPFVIAPATSSTSSTLSNVFGSGELFGSKPSVDGVTSTPSMSNFSSAFPAAPSTRPSGASAFSDSALPTVAKETPVATPAISATEAKTTPAIPVFNPPPAGFFGQKPSSSTPTFSLGQSPAAPPFNVTAPIPGGLFGQKPPSTPSPVFASGSTFSTSKPATISQPSSVGQPAAAFTSFGKPTISPSSTLPNPLAQIEDGMQKECVNLVLTMVREIENMKQLAAASEKKKGEHYKTLGVTHKASDLGDSTKFGIADAKEFGRLVRSLHKGVAELKELRATHLKAIRELEAAMLKVSMRKEEVVRFSKAKDDAEFAKILKARSLGPEHLETQIQLRRGVRLIRDRIQKLEDHLHASKKRLFQLKLGKPGLRPPSLDTINRTYHNIDIAVSQQEDDVDRLVNRVSKLKIGPPQTTPRIGRLPLELKEHRKHGVAVTPNVAATTAAALNAERAAQKLKGALLRARKEPLLNKQAVGTAAPSLELGTPQKYLGSSVLSDSESEPMWKPPPPPDFLATPNWTLPSFHTPDSPGSPSPPAGHRNVRRRESTSNGKHAKPIRKPTLSPSSSVTSSPPSNFSWGPLPGVTPMKMLSTDLRKGDDSPGQGSGSQPSLSSSWVADGFDTKK